MTALYRIVNRELQFVETLQIDMPSDPDAWLATNGYGRDYTLRRGKVIEMTRAERAAIHREHDHLKRAGALPSAYDLIAGKLAR